jgi:hypothetical protein
MLRRNEDPVIVVTESVSGRRTTGIKEEIRKE